MNKETPCILKMKHNQKGGERKIDVRVAFAISNNKG